MNNIEETIKQITKDIDFGGVMNSLDKIESPETIPFGLPSLDKITGIGGVPRGLITEIYGNPSSGKTALCLHLVSEAQKKNIKCLYVDVELALNKELAQKMGVDLSQLIVARPSNGEEAFEVVESMSEKGFGLIVVDSVASLSATPELESDYTENSIGLQARLISKAMRKIIGCIDRNKTALVFINQIRAKMATMPGAKQTTTSGGMAIPFYSALRLEITRIGWLPNAKEPKGMELQIMIEKNKQAPPRLKTVIGFMFDNGFDKNNDLLKVKLENKEVELIGRTYFVNGDKIGDREEILKYIVNEKKDK